MQKTVILGAGGQAKVIIEILREAGIYEPVACVAPHASPSVKILGVPIVGDDSCLPELRRLGIPCAFVALGDNALRERLMAQLKSMGFELASAVSPSATISPSARLGRGIAIMPGANIGADSTLADGVIVNSRASVDHDGRLQTCCHIGPGATLAGCVSVEARAFVATGASAIPGVTIGADSTVGAGSVVVRDIPAQVVCYGCPARIQRRLADADIGIDEGESRSESSTSLSPLRLVS